MSTHIVYIRPRDGFNPDVFDTHMRSYPRWARIREDLWMVATDLKTSVLRDAISAATTKNCDILVINISNDGWATLNIDRRLTDWMTEYV